MSNNGEWHTQTMARMATLDVNSLMYIRDDAYAAAVAGDGWNPKAGQYWDEYHYACMALKKLREAAGPSKPLDPGFTSGQIIKQHSQTHTSRFNSGRSPYGGTH